MLAVLIVMIVSFGGASRSGSVRSVKRSRFLAQLAQALRWDEPREDEDKTRAGRRDKGIVRHALRRHRGASRPDFPSPPTTRRTPAPSRSSRAPRADLDEAVRRTRRARRRRARRRDDPKRAALFRDGSRLRELVELQKIGRHFPLPRAEAKLEAARAALRTFERESRRDASACAVVAAAAAAALRPQLRADDLRLARRRAQLPHDRPILDGVADGSVTLDEVRNDVCHVRQVVFCVGAHLSAWVLTHKVTSGSRSR